MNIIHNSYTIISIQYFYTYEYMDTLTVYTYINIVYRHRLYIYIYISIHIYTGINFFVIYGGFLQWGYPNSWMVDFIENPSRNI